MCGTRCCSKERSVDQRGILHPSTRDFSTRCSSILLQGLDTEQSAQRGGIIGLFALSLGVRELLKYIQPPYQHREAQYQQRSSPHHPHEHPLLVEVVLP